MAPQQEQVIQADRSTAHLAARTGLFHSRGVLRPAWSILLFLTLLAGAVAAELLVLQSTVTLRSTPQTTLIPRNCIPNAALAVALCLSTWVLARIERRSFGDYGLRSAHPFRNLFGGALTGFALLSALLLLLHELDLVVFRGQVLFGAAEEWKLTLGWAAFYALAAFIEEFLVRGYLQYTMTRGLACLFRKRFPASVGVEPAFWISAGLLATLFALLQQRSLGETPLATLNVALFGLLMAFSLWRTGSLWWALGYHTAWDWAQSFLWGVPNSGIRARDHLFLTEPIGSVVRSGGSTGPEGSIYMLGALAAGFGILMLLHRSHVYPELWSESAPTSDPRP